MPSHLIRRKDRTRHSYDSPPLGRVLGRVKFFLAGLQLPPSVTRSKNSLVSPSYLPARFVFVHTYTMRFSLVVILLVSYRSPDNFAAAQDGLRISDAAAAASSSSSSDHGGLLADGLAAAAAVLAKFTSWADEHGKAYDSEEERTKKLMVWMENDGASYRIE
jgi:hypothetical protein